MSAHSLPVPGRFGQHWGHECACCCWPQSWETRWEKEQAKKNKRKRFDGLSGLVFSWWALSHLVKAVYAAEARKEANITQWTRFCVNRKAALNRQPVSLTSEKGGKWGWRGCFPRSLEALVKKHKCWVFFWTRVTTCCHQESHLSWHKNENYKIRKWASSSVISPQTDNVAFYTG